MDEPVKFLLPSPNFDKSAREASKSKPYYLTPSGMSLLPRERQPPPMYGKHGSTLPARYLKDLDKEQYTAPNPPEKQYCESCELELHSFEDLKRHRLQHENCPVAGCHYKGHPTVMDKHINTLHASGLFDKFKKLSTPEEIAAWREERRKRYPTLANVLLKQRAKEQRQRRGERLELSKKRFGNVNDRKRAQPIQEKETMNKDGIKTNHKNKRNRKNKHKNTKNQAPNLNVQNEKQNNDEKFGNIKESSSCGIQMFRGTCQLENYKHFNNKKTPVTNNVLYGLVGMYGSDEDDQVSEESDVDNDVKNDTVKGTKIFESNCDMPVEKFTKQSDGIEIIRMRSETKQMDEGSSNNNDDLKLKINGFSKSFPNSVGFGKTELSVSEPANFDTFRVEHSVDSLINQSDSVITIENGKANLNNHSSDEAPEEAPIERISLDHSLTSENNTKTKSFDIPERTKVMEQTTSKLKKTIKRKSGLDYRKARLRKQNTMLEKLLESDIRHERNVLLQCVRFVCENKFFNIGENKYQ